MISNTSRVRCSQIHRRLIPAALLAIAGTVGACGYAKLGAGGSSNETQSFFVHALNGSPLSTSNALAFPARAVTRVDGSFSFDVAFDINSAGFVMLEPPELVGQSPSGNRLVGILKSTSSYDNLVEAPLTGYTVDSITVIPTGQAVAVQATEPVCLSGNPVAPYLYAKIVIDSIDYVGRGIYGRAMIGGDCGYRQLIPGFPAF
jgi:hypothetical protein